jgi:DNA-binding XRE family transcriptional regulator
MPSARNYNELHNRVVARSGAPARLTVLRDQTRVEMTLAELRRETGYTQADLAEKLGITQSAISQIERGDDVKLSTLRAIVEALGGEMELRASLSSPAG